MGDIFAAVRVNALQRVGRCYELSVMGVLKSGSDEFMLVHGVVNGPDNLRTGHAWIETQDRVYDAALEAVFDAKEYRDMLSAVVVRQYSPKEAATLLQATDHYGPWHDDAEELRVDATC